MRTSQLCLFSRASACSRRSAAFRLQLCGCDTLAASPEHVQSACLDFLGSLNISKHLYSHATLSSLSLSLLAVLQVLKGRVGLQGVRMAMEI